MAKKSGAAVAVTDPIIAEQLRSLVSSLAASGASQWFASIRRRRPNLDSLYAYWQRRVFLDQVDDISEYCYKEGGKEYEYWIQIKGPNGETPKVDGASLGDFRLPALEEAEAPKDNLTTDPSLKDRQARIQNRRMELALEREEADLLRQQRRVDKLRNGEDDEGDDDEASSQYNPYDPYGVMQMGGMRGVHPMMHPMMNPMLNPMLRQPGGESKSDLAALLPIVMTGLKEIAAVVGGGNKPSPFELMAQFKTMMPDSLSPKDMMGMFSPIVSEMGKMSSEANKILMQSFATDQSNFKEQMLQLMIADGRPDDEITKLKRYMDVISETVGTGIKMVMTRGAAGKGKSGEAVEVPKLKKPGAPGLPVATDRAPAASVSDQAVAKDPAAEARRVISERVRAFVLTQEQEMLIGSEPGWAADKLDDLWYSIPALLRAQILESDVGKIYELLRPYEEVVVDRILAAVKGDATGHLTGWCVTFWEALKAPPDAEEQEPPGEEEQEPPGGGDPPPDGDGEGDPPGGEEVLEPDAASEGS